MKRARGRVCALKRHFFKFVVARGERARSGSCCVCVCARALAATPPPRRAAISRGQLKFNCPSKSATWMDGWMDGSMDEWADDERGREI